MFDLNWRLSRSDWTAFATSAVSEAPGDVDEFAFGQLAGLREAECKIDECFSIPEFVLPVEDQIGGVGIHDVFFQLFSEAIGFARVQFVGRHELSYRAEYFLPQRIAVHRPGSAF